MRCQINMIFLTADLVSAVIFLKNINKLFDAKISQIPSFV